jgi:hypothetical protein
MPRPKTRPWRLTQEYINSAAASVISEFGTCVGVLRQGEEFVDKYGQPLDEGFSDPVETRAHVTYGTSTNPVSYLTPGKTDEITLSMQPPEGTPFEVVFTFSRCLVDVIEAAGVFPPPDPEDPPASPYSLARAELALRLQDRIRWGGNDWRITAIHYTSNTRGEVVTFVAFGSLQRGEWR